MGGRSVEDSTDSTHLPLLYLDASCFSLLTLLASVGLFGSGKDVIGLAQTGSGKTAAFALPILHALLDKPERLFAAILSPTRYGFAPGTCFKISFTKKGR